MNDLNIKKTKNITFFIASLICTGGAWILGELILGALENLPSIYSVTAWSVIVFLCISGGFYVSQLIHEGGYFVDFGQSFSGYFWNAALKGLGIVISVAIIAQLLFILLNGIPVKYAFVENNDNSTCTIIILDTNESMELSDTNNESRNIVSQFILNQDQSERIGVITFINNKAHLIYKPSFADSQERQILSNSVLSYPYEGTSINGTLLKEFIEDYNMDISKSFGDRIILFTNESATMIYTSDLIKACEGIGNTEYDDIPVSTYGWYNDPANAKPSTSNILVVSDISSSMHDSDPDYNTFDNIKNIIDSSDSNDIFGLILFDEKSNVVYGYSELGNNSISIKKQLEGYSFDGGTNIQKAIIVAVDEIRQSDYSDSLNSIILLSDGGSIVNFNKIEKALESDKDGDIVIHTIAYGEFADTTTLSQIADITGGEFFATDDSQNIDNILVSAYEIVKDKNAATKDQLIKIAEETKGIYFSVETPDHLQNMQLDATSNYGKKIRNYSDLNLLQPCDSFDESIISRVILLLILGFVVGGIITIIVDDRRVFKGWLISRAIAVFISSTVISFIFSITTSLNSVMRLFYISTIVISVIKAFYNNRTKTYDY